MKKNKRLLNLISTAIRIMAGSIFLILLSPLILFILLIVFVELWEFPLFIQKRGITTASPFFLIKIKTVKKVNKTRRITRSNVFLKDELKENVPFICSILRRTGLDELPQLINIIKGEMNFIGPRPLPWDDVLFMEENEPELYDRRKKIKSMPGITGLWQLFGEKEKGIENLVELEELYESQKSVKLNSFILMNTLPKILFAKHQDSILGKKKLKFILTENILEK